MNHPVLLETKRRREDADRRAHESAEAQIVFRHFARVLERLVPPPRAPDRGVPAGPPPRTH
jgi:hypothetical protein